MTKSTELVACFLAVGNRVISAHFACSASFSYELLQLLARHFDSFMDCVLSPSPSATRKIGWTMVFKTTSDSGLTAVLIFAPGKIERGAQSYWDGYDMLRQILQDFHGLFSQRGTLTFKMFGDPRVRHEPSVLPALDILAMLSLPTSDLLQVTSIRDLEHPLLQCRPDPKERAPQSHHLQSGGSVALLRDTTANRPLKIAEVRTSFALYLIAVVEGVHARNTNPASSEDPMEKFRKFIVDVYKNNLAGLHQYPRSAPAPATPMPRAVDGPSTPLIILGRSGTEKWMWPRQFMRVHHPCPERDVLEGVEAVFRCLALANSRYLQQVALGTISSSVSSRDNAEYVLGVHQMVRDMTRAILDLPQDALKSKIVDLWVYHMQAARPFIEGAFSNFFALQRTPFVPDSRRPDQKDFHDWGSEDVPYFVGRWDAIMRNNGSPEDAIRAKGLNLSESERFESTTGKIYSTTLRDIDRAKDAPFPGDAQLLFHVPVSLLVDEAAIKAHLEWFENCIGLMPDTNVMAVLFEKPLSQPGKDFSSVRTRFREKSQEHSDKAFEFFEIWLLNPDEIKLMLPRCEGRKAKLAEEKERRIKEEIERLKREQEEKKEAERRREQEIREAERRREREIQEEAMRVEREAREQQAEAERLAERNRFAFEPEFNLEEAEGASTEMGEDIPEREREPDLLSAIRSGRSLKKVEKTVNKAEPVLHERQLMNGLVSSLASRRMILDDDDGSASSDDWDDEPPKAQASKEKQAPSPRDKSVKPSPASGRGGRSSSIRGLTAPRAAEQAIKLGDVKASLFDDEEDEAPMKFKKAAAPRAALHASKKKNLASSSSIRPASSAATISSASTLVAPPPPPAPAAAAAAAPAANFRKASLPSLLPPSPFPPPCEKEADRVNDVSFFDEIAESSNAFAVEDRAPSSSPLPLTLAGLMVSDDGMRRQSVPQIQAFAKKPIADDFFLAEPAKEAKEMYDSRDANEPELGSADYYFADELERTKDDYDDIARYVEEQGYAPDSYIEYNVSAASAGSVMMSSPPRGGAKKSGGGGGAIIIVLGMVVCCPCLTVAAPFYGLYWIGKEVASKVSECCDSLAEKWKNRKKSNIDDVFADMENVFNGLASCVLFCEVDPKSSKAPTHRQSPCCCFFSWNAGSTLRFAVFSVPLLILIYALVSAFAVSILLPCVFVLLIVRTAKVERKVDTGFAVRQQVLASESKAKKAMRGVSLLLRAIPMLGLVVAYPLIAVYVISAEHRDSAKIAIGAQLTFLAILQVLGSVRGLKSWVEANKEKDQVRVLNSMKKLDPENAVAPGELPTWVQAVTDPRADLADEEVRKKLALEPEPLANFNLVKPANWVTALGIFLEGIQLAFFANEFAPGSGEYEFTNAIFLRIDTFAPVDLISFVENSAIYIACACVALLVALFCVQLVKEVRRFGLLKRSGDSKAANSFFFYSFVGAIIYGHGEVRGVNRIVSSLAALLSDALFLIIASHLLSALICNSPVASQCWEGADVHRAAISLIALSFYVPLCVMIGPMLSEASADPSKPQPPSVKLAQPFLSVIAVSKFFFLLFAAYFAQGTPAATKPVLALIICLMVFLVLLGWAVRSGSTLLEARNTPRVPGLHVPINPPSLFIWRSLCYAAGVWGAIAALVTIGIDNSSMAGSATAERTKSCVLFIGLAVIVLLGVVWWLRWRQRDLLQREHLALLALMLQGKKPLSTSSSLSTRRKIPIVNTQPPKPSTSPFEADCILLDDQGVWGVLPAN